MSHLRFATRVACHLVILLTTFGAVNATAQQNSNAEHLHIEPTPDWVSVRDAVSVEDIPVDDVRKGVYYQLVDDQVKVDKDGAFSTHRRFIETITNQTGVETSSQINISFDPIYQRLVLNSLTVVRDGLRIDRLSDAKMSVFSRETDLDKQIYNGQLTLNILLDDVQAGDTLDYSYTKSGSNPVYQNIFSYSRSLNWTVPVHNQNLRVLWGKSTPLNVDFENIKRPITKKVVGDFTEYEIKLSDEEVLDSLSETPDWYSPGGKVHFNELSEWNEVVAWARPMYQFSPVHPTVEQVAGQIREASSTQAGYIAAALKYTQETIRYVGLEMGQNSHLPTAPQETLSLKYGDCKDKATLFISLLNALDIEAHPALVDTDNTKLLASQPVGIDLFNHVIVWLESEGSTYWLDPTLSSQNGSLENLYQPDYGYALVLKDGVNELTAMNEEASQSYINVLETFVIPANDDTPVEYTVKTRYRGFDAIRKLWQLERDGKKGVSEDYEVYYQRTYPGLKMSDELQIATDDKSGELTIEESYTIGSFWTEDDNRLEADFYATDIRDSVFKPEQSQRSGPLKVYHPYTIESQTRLEFEENDWEFNDEDFSEDNDFFSFTSDVSFVDNVLSLSFDYKSKADHIPHDRVDEYLDVRTKVRENTYYGIYKGAESEETADSAAGDSASGIFQKLQSNWIWVAVWAYLLGLAFMIINWQIESRARQSFAGSEFYPVAAWKFVLLGIVTFGLYNMYWMYRNWKAVKASTGESILPVWRGIFDIFWVYPLFKVLKRDSEDTFGSNKVVTDSLAVLIAAAYLIVSLVSNLAENTPIIFAYVLTPFLLLPFVNYIQLRNEEYPEALNFNSQFRARHVVSLLLAVPLIIFALAPQARLIPTETVVTQSELLERDLKFFYRQKLVYPGERVQYFYSDAIFDIKKDGNGFTEERVFSYWVNESDEYEQAVATFDEIKDVSVEFAENGLENSVITITRHDDTNFMLFVSSEDEGDKLFVKELKKLWEAVRPSEE